jgi:hypothetical protein
MPRLTAFILGAGIGIYTAQNYDIPDMKKLGEKIIDYIKSMEKKD